VKPKHQRLCLIVTALVGLGLSAALALVALQDTLVFFYTPSDLSHKQISPQQRIRVGGIVAKESVRHQDDRVQFHITDQEKTVTVTYRGILPDLFREGQGVVVEGYLQGPSRFHAELVLAKHDETYMPKEVAERCRVQ
jgi:cytochrome c-type biogenesis protein CcmE